jgi:ATP-dependent exoDNAse (exonuclease V) beta subunit
MSANQSVKIIGASAGTGKTTRLAREFLERVSKDHDHKTSPDKILVSTFTIKAAEELKSRIRQSLIGNGQWASAQLVRTSYVGTVNAICGKILQDYALDGGLSPIQNVIPEPMERAIFSIAADPIIDIFAQELDEVAARLSFDELPKDSKFSDGTHWTSFVADVCRLARANRISPKQFADCAQKSWEGLERCLPSIHEVAADELDRHFVEALQDCINRIEASNDSTKKTQTGLEKLKEVYSRTRRMSPSWYDWATVAKTDVSKASADCVKELIAVASLHPRHPRLRDDIRTLINQVFACAAESLQAYQDYKLAAGLVDFTDQEYRALELLENKDIRTSLASRIDAALIDEFQDTSPIQLALFLQLAGITKSSVWVGDIKQAIYGFRGTDPQLMQSANETFSSSGAQRLDVSYRSRRELVDFSNDLFTAAFSPFGIKHSDVAIQSHRPASTSAATPALELWKCSGQKLNDCFQSLALAINEFLAGSANIKVVDKELGYERPLRASDIAILCRANDRAEGIAQALTVQGLKVAIATDGLLETPECVLAIASLKYLLDRRDRLALGELIHLTRDYTNETQDHWLKEWLLDVEHPERLFAQTADFDLVRPKLATLTAIESLQFALTAGKVLETVAAWGNVRERFSNLDALRGLVIDYESVCSMQKSAASASGFITYLNRLKESRKPASSDQDAVQVLTYHGSKGLEWPIVILTDLDKAASPNVHKDLCAVSIETGDDKFDALNPLKGRWIRFWPWPYGKLEQGVHLDVSAANSADYASLNTRLRAESIRLLYVGITRARDLLVFAPYTGRRGQADGLDWINDLKDQNGAQIISFPIDDGLGTASVSGNNHEIRIRSAVADSSTAPANQPIAQQIFLSSPVPERPAFLPSLLKPSKLLPAMSEPGAVVSTIPVIHDIGTRIPITGLAEMNTIGDCIHRFLAADDRDEDENVRLTRADRLRDLWSVFQISAESMVEMSDRLFKFVDDNIGDCAWYRECPITGRVGHQRVHGVIDLLLETQEALFIVDHKSFPGASDKWVEKALSFSEQLNTYAKVLSQASSKPVKALYIHMPIVGKVVTLR